jgi:hypothetical protein
MGLRELTNPVIPVIGSVTNEPTGFLNLTDSVLSFVDGTRTFTIAPAVSAFEFYCAGVRFEKISGQNIVIPDTEGLHFIYFDCDGNLQSTTTFSISLILSEALVAVIYWDATNNEAILIGEERHGLTMDGATHALWHLALGTSFLSGLALNTIDADASGNNNTSAQLGVDAGEIADEDIRHTIGAQAHPANLPVFFLDGASAEWRRDAATDYPVKRFGTNRLAWNEFTGGAWQQTEVGNNDFMNMHIFAVNDPDQPIIAVQGQDAYGNVNAARQGANVEINNLILSGLPTAEFIVIATVIFQTSNGYTNAVQSRIRSTDEGDDYVDWRLSRLSPSAGAQAHNNLSGRDQADAHPVAAIDFDAANEALGGGAAATLGTIGGTGPTAAAQAQWLKVEIDGVDHYLAVWA